MILIKLKYFEIENSRGVHLKDFHETLSSVSETVNAKYYQHNFSFF